MALGSVHPFKKSITSKGNATNNSLRAAFIPFILIGPVIIPVRSETAVVAVLIIRIGAIWFGRFCWFIVGCLLCNRSLLWSVALALLRPVVTVLVFLFIAVTLIQTG